LGFVAFRNQASTVPSRTVALTSLRCGGHFGINDTSKLTVIMASVLLDWLAAMG
jgi:hypothetical protein